MKRWLIVLFVSLAIPPVLASDQYILNQGNTRPIQHWQYPSTVIMNGDDQFYYQDMWKIAFNQQDGKFYYISDIVGTTPVWLPIGGGSGGGSTTFIGLIDVPHSYTGQANKLVSVNSGETALQFVSATGGGNVSNSGTPINGQLAGWTDATHIQGVTNNSPNWDTAYTDRLKWDGGATGLNAASGRTNLGLVIGANVEAWDNDLDLIAALTTTTFGRGALTQTDATAFRSYIGAGSGGGDLSSNTSISVDSEMALFNLTSGKSIKRATGTGIVTMASGVVGTITDNSANWNTAFTQNRQWDGGATGLNAANGRTNLGLVIGSNVEAWDADLDALAALSGTGTMYYRSGVAAWSPVTMGTNMTFSGGVLSSTGGGGSGDVSSNTSVSVDGEVALFNLTTGKSIRRATGSGIATLSSGVLGTTTNNSTFWDTGYSERRQWDGSSTNLVAATGRASLALNNVTNDIQTQAAIVPNTIPTDGQLLVGATSISKYVPRNISGSGATITMSNAGVVSISGIANTSLANSSVTIAGDVVALGGSTTLDQITNLSTLGYVKRTAANTLSTVTTIPNADLTNSSITVGNAAAATSLGGTVSADSILGIGPLPVGILKRTNGNTMGIAVAGTDYKLGTQNTINVRIITATTTYTPTAGVTALFFEGVGGGGGGGSVFVTTNSAYAGGGGGGGGGGYASAYAGTPAATYAITIGGGGAGGAGSGNNAGNSGGTTTVSTILTAPGGIGGGASNGGFYMGSTTAIGGDGATGTVGIMLASGSDGGNGTSSAAAFTAPGTFTGIGFGGNGGGSIFGGGGKPSYNSTNGVNGGQYGGGGGGAAYTGVSGVPGGKAGGAGASGVVRVWEIF
jgi:hypothetical protein